ncbi:MAG: type I-E CRISPR-associated protein Cse1/CasA [Ottowia sp.]|nr:type I-E CRISPR-associated protein Cse1/CasA [Ottowia sp.]
MQQRFNLVDEPWLPVAGHGLVSLRSIFERSDLPALGGSVTEKIAITKLLQAIAQAACTPKDDDEWQRLGEEGMARACLGYLERWHGAFWLYHPEKPFLQFPAVAKAEIKPYGALMPEIATGNTSIVFQQQVPPEPQQVSDDARARLVLVHMSCCFSGKKVDASVTLSPGTVKSKSAKPGPALCSIGLLHSFLHGQSVRQSVWLNLLTLSDVQEEKTFTLGIGTPPWERMPAGENDALARALQHSLMGRLVPMARFILLHEQGAHYVEGLQHPDYLHGGMMDPSAAGDFSKAKPKMLWADPDKRPWRSLTALLAFLNKSDVSAFICPQLKYCATRLHRADFAAFRLWSGGIRLSSNAGEQYLTGSDDVVESELDLHTDWLNGEASQWFDQIQRSMSELEQLNKVLYASVASYYKDAGADNAGDLAARAAQEFWQMAERHFPALSRACYEAENAPRQSVMHRMQQCARQSYEHACPQDTARQLQIFVKHQPRLSKEAP